ncbi:hypothetical protein [Candidatus Marinarcus aquaticus]|uniref:MFS transporter n=1 Tax=Candidatus Marinarcus aquaticus TaxID=2044504 RepID=A0A4Q0XRM4_9BACT|nr:hypothetical protein [Candidatus Marinarcus aquaticus]RXJ60147.1 hypothetical protein CRV04_03855 [Candidatus Marinarcus aquaticus]
MAYKYYATIFHQVQKSKFLKIQSWTLFLTTYIDWVLIPFVTKLEGTFLPVYMISFYMLLGSLDGFIHPLFKNIKIHHIYLFTIVLDLIQISSYFLFSYSVLLFTYVILTIFTVQAITFEIARIHTVDFMQDEEITLKDYLMLRSFMISLAIVLGSITAMIFDYATTQLNYLLIFLSVIGLIGITLQYKLYLKFKTRVLLNLVEIQKDKTELFEKFRT